MSERQAKQFLVRAAAAVLVVIVAAELATYFLGEHVVVRVAGMVAIGAAITGLTVEAYRRRDRGDRTGGAR
ncbi:hypothetical protein ACH4OX_36755 [Streptomyces roseolus]|uniref:hypothetical protein n=1 Tax=Streptomyces roseolus TaxID=67358 RepID=UPI0037A569CD